MKITFTFSEKEILAIVKDTLLKSGVISDSCECSIRITKHERYNPVTEFMKSVSGITHMVPDLSRKIEAIKTLRTLAYQMGYDMGLANAKYAVEHWDAFCNFIRANHRLPNLKESWYSVGFI